MPFKTFPEVIDPLFKLTSLVVNLPNQLQYLLWQRPVHSCMQLYTLSPEIAVTRAFELWSNVELPSRGYQG